MQERSDSKYLLKDLYQEIDLLDRKITHCNTHERFQSDQERETALQKLVKARAKLVNSAQRMTNEGVLSDSKHLPRSLKENPLTSKVIS